MASAVVQELDELQLAVERERVYAARDARRRANAEFAVKQGRRLVLTVLAITSIVIGWPTSPMAVVRRAEAVPKLAAPHKSAGSQRSKTRIPQRSSGK